MFKSYLGRGRLAVLEMWLFHTVTILDTFHCIIQLTSQTIPCSTMQVAFTTRVCVSVSVSILCQYMYRVCVSHVADTMLWNLSLHYT